MEDLEIREYYLELINEYQKQKEINSNKRMGATIIFLIAFLLSLLGSQIHFNFITNFAVILGIVSIIGNISCEIENFKLQKIYKELNKLNNG